MTYVKKLEEEIRCNYKICHETKLLWNRQLEMVSAVIDICNKNNIKVWGFFGTMLGAVRHKGYIPWDDDMDLIMMRSDYTKFCKVVRENLPPNMFFQNAYTDPGYNLGFAKIRYNGTSMIHHFDIPYNFDWHQGIFIDIFVLDELPLDKNIMQENDKLRENIYYFMRYRRYPNLLAEKFIDAFKLALKLGHRAFWSDKKLFKYAENRIINPKGGVHKNKVGLLGCGIFDKWIFEKEWFEETIWLPFENIMLPVPSAVENLLEWLYGNYMTPVMGGSNHEGSILDLEKDYTKYLPILKTHWSKHLYQTLKNIVHKRFKHFCL